jgi:hypothetical protein
MSFVIRGGYDIFRKQVLNLSLKQTDKWTHGLVMVKKNMLVYNLVPRYDNTFEMVKYNDIHALVLNNTIIYEDKKLFSYKLDLHGPGLNVNDPNLYDFLDCKYVDYANLKWMDTRRQLN